ncbi:MAG: hypothetical protein KF914_01455 [Rhizobiaceae bacterium]|nr:hypothetical protein [Rhizobiaceae bacterium]
MTGFYVFSGVWGLVMIAIFIAAIRLSYRIEARSPDLVNRTGIPRRAMIFHTVTNLSVARDAETQAMRRRMNGLLLLNLLGFLGLWIAIWLTGRA